MCLDAALLPPVSASVVPPPQEDACQQGQLALCAGSSVCKAHLTDKNDIIAPQNHTFLGSVVHLYRGVHLRNFSHRRCIHYVCITYFQNMRHQSISLSVDRVEMTPGFLVVAEHLPGEP